MVIVPVNIIQVDRNVLKAEYNGFEIIAGRPSDDEEYVGMPWGVVMIAGLGLCTVSRVLDQIVQRAYQVELFSAVVNTKLDEDRSYAEAFVIDVVIESDLPEDKLKEILFEAEQCFALNTFRNQPEINVNIELM